MKFVVDLSESHSNMLAPGQPYEANLSWRIWIQPAPKTQKSTKESESGAVFLDICLAYGQHLALIDDGVNSITAYSFTPLMILLSFYFCMFDDISSSIKSRYLLLLVYTIPQNKKWVWTTLFAKNYNQVCMVERPTALYFSKNVISPKKCNQCGSLIFFMLAWTSSWIHFPVAGDLGRHDAYMTFMYQFISATYNCITMP